MAWRVGKGTALLFHDRGTRRGWVVSSTPRPHFTPGKEPVSILQETGWAPQVRSGRAENLVPTGIRFRTVQPVASRYKVKWSEVNKASEVEWGEVKCNRGRGERIFMEKFYRSSKWWEVKDWGESVSELVTGESKSNNRKLYTVLSYWGVFTFCTRCKILICLVCIVDSFKLSCV